MGPVVLLSGGWKKTGKALTWLLDMQGSSGPDLAWRGEACVLGEGGGSIQQSFPDCWVTPLPNTWPCFRMSESYSSFSMTPAGFWH